MDDGVRAMYVFTIYLRTEDIRYFEAFDLKSDVKVMAFADIPIKTYFPFLR